MDAQWAAKLLDILIENSIRILDAGFGLGSVEGTFFDVVALLKREPSLRPRFLELARATLLAPDPGLLEPGLVPIELIELVVHELRWEEFRELAAHRIADVFGGDPSFAAGDIACKIPEAYREDWDGKIFYARYQS